MSPAPSPSRALLALTLLLAGSGCTVGPKYTRPTVPAPPAYKETNGWKQAEPHGGVLHSDWWRIFQMPELDKLEAQVDGANQALKVAEAHFREARALVRVVRAGLYPTVSAAPDVSGNRLSNYRPGGASPSGPYGDLTLPFDLSYELDAWGRIRRSITAAREEVQATAADLETIRLSLHAELAVDYFELRSVDAQKRLLDATLVAYGKALQLTQNRFDGGLAAGAEVAQARTQLETTRAQDIEVGVERAQFEHAIAILTGRAPAELTLAVDPLNSAPPPIPAGVPSQLLERRPDIASTERRVAESNEQIGIAQAAFFPTLLITATGGFEGGSLVNWFNWPSRFWAIGPTAIETIFDAGRRRAAAEAVLADYDATVATYRNTALVAFQEVEDNLSTLRVLEQESQAQRVAVQAAQHSLDLSLNRYKGGLVTYLEVASAQTIALQNERVNVDLLRRRMDATVLLIKALGGGWDASKLPSTASLR